MRAFRWYLAFTYHVFVRRATVRLVLVPYWWFMGIMMTANLEKARKQRMLRELQYWTRRAA